MNVSVCIPSYRKDVVKTLQIVPDARVFVAESDAERYRKNNPGACIMEVPEDKQGNVSVARNYILDHEFARGVDAVCIMDDDIFRFCTFENDAVLHRHGRDDIPVTDFHEFLEHYTRLCMEFGFKLWGVNQNKDRQSYAQYTPFSTTSCILGPFSVHLDNPIRYDTRLPLKEDYDLSLQHLNRYRGVLRVNAYHYECDQSDAPGGCASIRNREREEQQMQAFIAKWGSSIVKRDLGKMGNGKKDNGFGDINPIVKAPIKGV